MVKNDTDYLGEIDALTAKVAELTAQLAAKSPAKAAGAAAAGPQAGGDLLARYEAVANDPRQLAIFMRDNAAALNEFFRTGATTAAVVEPVSMATLEQQYSALTSDSERQEFLRKNATALSRAA